MYRTIEHQADIAVEIKAVDRAGLFCTALEALVSLLTGNKERVSLSDCSQVVISASGYDDEECLVDLLNELIFLCQVHKKFPVAIRDVHFDADQEVSAKIFVLEARKERAMYREIKAATYHNLRIIKSPSWRTEIVFDV
ncbi:MAG: archease [Calditrichaeota bacterium]|nr:archease [Calditrichota bacterium]